LNPLNAACKPGEKGVCLTQLEAENPPAIADPVLFTTRIQRFTLNFDFHEFTYDQLFKSGKDYKFYGKCRKLKKYVRDPEAISLI